MNQREREAWCEHALLCRWLSTLLAQEFDEATLQAYLAGEASPLLATLAEDAQLVPMVEQVRQALDGLHQLAEPRLELAADFAALFLLDARLAAPPYASLYQGEGARFHQQPTERMERRLDAAGYRVDGDFREPADHLAIMLDYLATGLEQLADGPEPARRREIREGLAQFIEQDLAWLPSFAQRCQQVDTVSDFYPCIAQLTAAYCVTLLASLVQDATH